jgi:UTP--glucose-1-phosphate uridylyltransferase
VIQLETAMGAAIGVFEGAAALRVPRTRFIPVKTTDHLLAVRSDAYSLTDDLIVRPAGERIPLVKLDPEYFKLIDDFEARFPHGPPSLVECRRLEVEGDVSFGRDVVVRGEVKVEGPRRVGDGEVLEG